MDGLRMFWTEGTATPVRSSTAAGRGQGAVIRSCAFPQPWRDLRGFSVLLQQADRYAWGLVPELPKLIDCTPLQVIRFVKNGRI
ncbi:hypothetical protein MASR2M32_27380 [Sphaerotilus sulfidivorans]